jgi:hypothetical protein
VSDKVSGWVGKSGQRLVLPWLVALCFLALQFVAAPAVMMTNDSYRYARSTLQILGDTRQEAQDKALAALCADTTARAQRARKLDPARFREPLPSDHTAKCIARFPNGLTPNMPRYEAIFDARLGYPVLAAPLTKLLGVKEGLHLTSVLFTALGGVLAYMLLRSAGVPGRFAALGQMIYYVTPIGFRGSYPLTEGPTMALTMAALLGAWWMMQRRTWPGAALLVTSLVIGFFVRYPSLLMVAGALSLSGLIALWRSHRARHTGTYLMIATNVAWAVGAAASAHALRWPGLSETLQDTFTHYFTLPDVGDPWRRLARLNVNFWTQWVQDELRAPWLLLIVGISVWALFRRSLTLAVMVTAVAATGPATFAAHPVWFEEQRLMMALWLAPVVGLPILLSRTAVRADSTPPAEESGRVPGTGRRDLSGTSAESGAEMLLAERLDRR